MATETLKKPMTGEEMIALSKKHTLFEWSAQSKVDPIPVARAKGIYFWTPEGKRFIDFNSQLMCVNIGHGDERVIRAIQEQAEVLVMKIWGGLSFPQIAAALEISANTAASRYRYALAKLREQLAEEPIQ